MVGRVAIALAGVFLATAACGSKQAVLAPTAADPFAGATCGAVKPPLEPELMAWDAVSRAQLDKLRRQGVVAVRYEAKGCEISLELLPDCIGPKNLYVYSGMGSSDSRVARNIDQLLAQLPVGASNVSTALQGDQALRADFRLVGAAALPVGTKISEYDLVGPACRGATHVVSAVYVGGFGLAREPAGASANAFTGGIDAITREGYPAVCDRAQTEGIELGGCSTPLRVGLIPLNGEAPPPTCPSGWSFDGKRCAKADAPMPLCSTSGGATAQAACASIGGDAGADVRIFDASTIERLVRDRSPTTKRVCWESAPPAVRSMSVTIATTVDVRGRVVSAEPQLVASEGPTDVASQIARCIANDVLSWEFPPPESAKSFQLPFHLLRQ